MNTAVLVKDPSATQELAAPGVRPLDQPPTSLGKAASLKLARKPCGGLDQVESKADAGALQMLHDSCGEIGEATGSEKPHPLPVVGPSAIVEVCR